VKLDFYLHKTISHSLDLIRVVSKLRIISAGSPPFGEISGIKKPRCAGSIDGQIAVSMSYFIATSRPLLANPQGIKDAFSQRAIWKSLEPRVGRTTNHRDSISHSVDRGVGTYGRRLRFLFLPNEKNKKI
jgi:hypothetical protein